MAIKKITKLAKTVNAQINPNLPTREGWKNCDKALTNTTSTYAVSHATMDKTRKKFNHPYTLTAHKFELNLPSNAYVSSVKFHIRMRAVGKQHKNWKIPTARFNIYGSAYKKDYDKGGWDDGIYYSSPKKYISNSWQTYTYTMAESDVKKGGFKINNFNAEIMGVDFIFSNPESFTVSGKSIKEVEKKGASAEVDVAWVKVEIQYEIPTYKISYKAVSSSGRRKCIKATFTQSSKANGGTQVLDVDIPWGTELVSPTSTTNGFNPVTRKWTVNAKAKANVSVDFCIDSFLEGEQTLNIGNTTTKQFPYKYTTPSTVDDGYDDISLSIESEAHKNSQNCLIVGVEGESTDNNVTFTTSMNKAFTPIGWTLSNGSDGVEVASTTDNSVTLTVPSGERFTAYLRYCFIPTTTGSYTASVNCDDMGRDKTLTFSVASAYVYHLGSNYTEGIQYANFTTDIIKVNTHRFASKTDTVATVIPLRSDEYDAVMHISPCTLHLNRWAELDYIGCVPLEHLHFDPKSTYKDKLLDTHYKNKRYMGKQLASDEDITLNVRLHPQQVTTIQGLIDMDKPIPINANHKCFEGDALNHRGWAEIYGITTTRTNPHWYKCDIDVKYLTHNLNTRFKIDKGNLIYNQPISPVMAEVFERGDKLAEDITQDFFTVVTDGTYMYNTSEVVEVDYLTSEGYEVVKNGSNAEYTDSSSVTHTLDTLANYVAYLENNNYDVVVPTTNGDTIKVKALLDVPTNQRNMFSIDNGQYIDIKTRNTLGTASEVTFEWANVVSDELRENNLERIIELVDKATNEPVFKYQYSDFKYDYDDTTDPQTIESVRATPIAYVRKNGDWITQSEEIELDTIIETGGIIDDTDDATPIDTSSDDEYQDDNTDTSELIIGSTIHFQLDNHTLKVIDEGFNSREFETSTIELEGESYYWRTIWTNKNSDGESNDMICFFDFSVSDTIVDTQYADKYSKLVVSPFPVSDKKLVFNREAEEGTVYYYEDDGEEFSYLIEPYYQYMNGTDLVTDSGISIFNLNYGYKLVYIQNGLVRLGFDRIDGRLYLGKYDSKSGAYITTHHMHLDKYSDINVRSISDDKIEIQASDSIFTIWRGHPYIMINHSNEDIWIDTRFNKIWAEKVGGDDASELPIYWDLMNNANILPSCVGGTKEIRSSCIEVESVDDTSKTDTDLVWDGNQSWSDFEVDTDLTFTLSSSTFSQSDEIDIGVGHCIFGDYTVEIGHDYSVVSDVAIIGDSIIQNGDSGILKAKVTGYDYTPIEGKSVDFIQKNKQIIEDNAVTDDNKSDYWAWNTTYVTQTVASTGTTVANSDSSSNRVYTIRRQNTGSDYAVFPVYNCIEFDLISYTGTIRFQQIQGTLEKTYTFDSVGHIKIENDENYISIYVDGVRKSRLTNNLTDLHQIKFALLPNSSFTYKNFKVYNDTVLTGTTDLNGIVNYPFVADGTGEKVFYAVSDNLKSDEITVIDGLFADKGISGQSSSDWYNLSNRIVSTVDSNGTLLETSTNNGYWFANLKGTSTGSIANVRDYTTPICVEVDLVETNSSHSSSSDYYGLMFNDGTDHRLPLKSISPTAKHLKIELDGTNAVCYADTLNEPVTIPLALTGNFGVSLMVRSASYMKYKNFVIYPFESEEPFNSLTLTSNKNILSAYDSETATLTATYTEDGVGVSGKTVTFKKGSSTLATETTNSSGVATYDYSANGDGDVTITVECSNLQETYTIEDCLITLLPETTIVNDSGTKISSIGLDTIPNIQNTDFILSFEHKGNGTLSIGSKNSWSSSSANYRLTLGYADNKHYYSVRTSSTNEGYGASASTSTNYEYRIEREGSSIRFYQGETLITTQTATFLTSYNTWSIYSLIWGSATSVFKNIKLKPL